jgi:predicted amidohydrolase
MRTSLTIAAAQPRCVTKDVGSTAVEHASMIRTPEARLIVFPESSLTGYDLDVKPISPNDDVLTDIVEACADTESVELIGAPVAGGAGTVQICVLLVSPSGAKVAYRKSYLGGDEPTRFSPGNGPAALEIDGWRIGLGICKDTGVGQHIADTAALNIDLYVAGVVHLPNELAMQEERAVRIALACRAYVAFASFAGATGGGFDHTAGVSSIWTPDGIPIARAGVEPGDLARATLDVDT